MKVTITPYVPPKRVPLTEFADTNSLELCITQHEWGWAAHFNGAERCFGRSMLESTYGKGTTPLSAVNDYVSRIRGERLRIQHTYIHVPFNLFNDWIPE